ncbi:MAG: hypothetical protein ACI8XB_002923, partial [Patiriisocius sp.]
KKDKAICDILGLIWYKPQPLGYLLRFFETYLSFIRTIDQGLINESLTLRYL